eukprot:90847_1
MTQPPSPSDIPTRTHGPFNPNGNFYSDESPTDDSDQSSDQHTPPSHIDPANTLNSVPNQYQIDDNEDVEDDHDGDGSKINDLFETKLTKEDGGSKMNDSSMKKETISSVFEEQSVTESLRVLYQMYNVPFSMRNLYEAAEDHLQRNELKVFKINHSTETTDLTVLYPRECHQETYEEVFDRIAEVNGYNVSNVQLRRYFLTRYRNKVSKKNKKTMSKTNGSYCNE